MDDDLHYTIGKLSKKAFHDLHFEQRVQRLDQSLANPHLSAPSTFSQLLAVGGGALAKCRYAI